MLTTSFLSDQTFEVFQHCDNDLIAVGDVHQRQAVDGPRSVDVVGAPWRDEGVRFA